MKDMLTAFFMICLLSTTALNVAFSLRPDAMTDIVRGMTQR